MLIILEKELLSVFDELPPTISYPIFTPLHLFFLLNLLIVSIILITRLHREAPRHEGGASARARHRHTVPAALPLDHHGEANYAENQTPYSAEVFELPDDDGEHAEMYSREKQRSHFDRLQKSNGELETDATRSDEGRSKSAKCLVRSDHQKQMDGLVKQSAAIVMEFASNADNYVSQGKAIKEVISEEIMIRGENAAEMAYGAPSFDKQKSSEQCSCSPTQERPLASTHFSHKRTTNRIHACKSPLKISRPSARRGDTLDATWKAICEQKSKHSSPFRHRVANRTRKDDCHTTMVEVTCSKTRESHLNCFSPSKQRHRMTSSSTNGLVRRREPSISRDELNARVESFISRFNQQIKIQRQESLLSHKRMVNRDT
ncbi:hypothetical protein GOP47_0019672 [Adiantum capillus-veneris]|uniref:DUF4408 domain-containing protein n=1 Tax=Adiantum capillus-veneris TaxID=13818 RepID=A0A9D4UC86_ADICA|nr:hypothetical protein GOP47_0019672 [Adiantum capillus-veneris]